MQDGWAAIYNFAPGFSSVALYRVAVGLSPHFYHGAPPPLFQAEIRRSLVAAIGYKLRARSRRKPLAFSARLIFESDLRKGAQGAVALYTRCCA
jgi:hypothetical protein